MQDTVVHVVQIGVRAVRQLSEAQLLAVRVAEAPHASARDGLTCRKPGSAVARSGGPSPYRGRW